MFLTRDLLLRDISEFYDNNMRLNTDKYLNYLSETYLRMNYLDSSIEVEQRINQAFIIDSNFKHTIQQKYRKFNIKLGTNVIVRGGDKTYRYIITSIGADKYTLSPIDNAPTGTVGTSYSFTINSFRPSQHLSGEEVSVVGDGSYLGEFIMNSEVTLDAEYEKLVIGYKYLGYILGNNIFPRTGRKKINEVRLDVFDTVSMKYAFVGHQIKGINNYRPFLSEVRDVASNTVLLDTMPRPFSKIVDLTQGDLNFIEKRLYLVQDVPFPASVRNVTIKYDSEE